MIKIKDIYKSYGEKENKVEVLKGINLNIEDGDFVVILGLLWYNIVVTPRPNKI